MPHHHGGGGHHHHGGGGHHHHGGGGHHHHGGGGHHHHGHHHHQAPHHPPSGRIGVHHHHHHGHRGVQPLVTTGYGYGSGGFYTRHRPYVWMLFLFFFVFMVPGFVLIGYASTVNNDNTPFIVGGIVMLVIGGFIMGIAIRRARNRAMMGAQNVSVISATHTTTAPAPNYGAAAAAPSAQPYMPQPASNPAYSQVPTSSTVSDAPPAYNEVVK